MGRLPVKTREYCLAANFIWRPHTGLMCARETIESRWTCLRRSRPSKACTSPHFDRVNGDRLKAREARPDYLSEFFESELNGSSYA
jgi:hypothetical protein